MSNVTIDLPVIIGTRLDVKSEIPFPRTLLHTSMFGKGTP